MEYKVSRQTAELIRAYDLLAKVQEHVSEALEELYSPSRVDEMIEEEITPDLIRLQRVIMSWIEVSIIDKRGLLGSDEI